MGWRVNVGFSMRFGWTDNTLVSGKICLVAFQFVFFKQTFKFACRSLHIWTVARRGKWEHFFLQPEDCVIVP